LLLILLWSHTHNRTLGLGILSYYIRKGKEK
jgi:hypothetical protein